MISTIYAKKGYVPERKQQAVPDVSGAVADIIRSVVSGGDRALLELGERFDGVRPSSLEVTREELESAYQSASPELVAALERAAANITEFHAMQKREDFTIERADGSVLGQRIIPLSRVGVYVPGGRASYPSTVLMDILPAKIAGVEEIIMVTPPAKDGSISKNVLAAARIAGADRVFKAGGAQAVAALAYGTESIPAVDKIVGPGNIYVAEAKRQVSGRVGIDMFAGPSEIMIIADGTADPVWVAADMLSQAEHDPIASAILITDCEALAKGVSAETERQLPLLPRYETARASTDDCGMIIITESIKDAVGIINSYAPEHLELCTENPCELLPLVKNAGAVFLGHWCPEAVGDYIAGSNHTLPTSGTARFSGPLSVDDFTKRSSFISYTKGALEGVRESIAALSGAEGLQAHGRSVSIRFEGEEK